MKGSGAAVLLGLAGSLALAPVAAAARPRTVKHRDAAPASRFSSLVVFGDSFSDNGNGSYQISNGTWPLVPPYYDGRFSNGPVWAEYLAARLALPLHDYATGGATTSNALVQGYTGPNASIPVPSVADQTAAFLAAVPPAGGTAPLFAVLAGANDVLFDASVSAAQSFRAIRAAVAALLAAYPAARVVTVAMPDIARLPYAFYVRDAAAKAQLRAFTRLLAELLASPAASSSSSAAAAVQNVDLSSLFDDFEYFAAPEKYGFAPLGKYGSCLVGVYGEGGGADGITECDDADKRVYWDEYHPTTRTHSFIAELVLNATGLA